MDQQSERTNDNIFTKKEVENFVSFFDTLKSIHNRLLSEGWKYINGELIPPKTKIGNQEK